MGLYLWGKISVSQRIMRSVVHIICHSHLSAFFVVCFIFCLFRAAPAAYGGSQARGLIRAVATGLRQSLSNARSEPRLQPTPQLTAMPDP